MPYKDPKLQEKPKPTDQFGNRVLAENLELLNHISRNMPGNEILVADAKGASQKVAVAHQSANALSLNDDTYAKVVVPKIKPLDDIKHAGNEEKAALSRRIFDAVAISGTLGIDYDYNSDNRLTKSPDEVLTKVKGKYRADCDELAFTFLAIAKKAGLDIQSFQFIELTFEVAGPAGKKTEEKHAAVVQIDGNTFVLELTRSVDGFKQIPDATLASLREYYIGKTFEGINGVITYVKSLTPRTTESEIEASFHAERARTLNNQGKILEAIAEYETIISLDKKYEGAADKLVELYFAAADKYTKTDAEKEAYYKRAVETAPESYRARFKLGAFYAEMAEQKGRKPEEATAYFEKAATEFLAAITISKIDQMTFENLLYCFNRLKRFDDQISHAERLLQINQNNAEAYVYLVIGYVEKAKREYIEKPDHGDATYLFEKALGYYRQGLEYVKSDTPLFNELKRQKSEIDVYVPLMH